MTDQDPDRPGQMLLDDLICDAIKQGAREWTLTDYDVVGVLTIIAARIAHKSVTHDEEI